MIKKLLTLAQTLDDQNLPQLADAMERVAMRPLIIEPLQSKIIQQKQAQTIHPMQKLALPYHATHRGKDILEQGYAANPRPEDIQYNIDHFFHLLPPAAQKKVQQTAEEEDPTVGRWGPEYWIENEAAITTLFQELKKVFPHFKLIWGTDYPSKEQVETYGPDIVEFEESPEFIPVVQRKDSIGSRAWIFPTQSEEEPIPPQFFHKLSPKKLKKII